MVAFLATRMISWLLTALLIYISSLVSARSDVDSLKYVLQQQDGLPKAEVLFDLVDLLKHEQPKEALHYAGILKEIVKVGGEIDRYKVNQQLARIYFNMAIYDSSKYYHQKCLEIARKLDQPKLISASLLNISEDERMLGNADAAMGYLLQTKNVVEGSDNQQLMADVYNNIGISFKNMRKYKEALEYYRKSLDLIITLTDTLDQISSQATTLHNIGIVFGEKGDLDSAQYYFEEALGIRRQINDTRGVVSTLNNIAGIYSWKGNYERAKTIFIELIDQTKAIDDTYGTALAYHNLGSVYKSLGTMDSAIFWFNEALTHARVTGANYFIQETHQQLSNAYEENGMYKNALLHLKEYINIKDSISNIQRIDHLNELQTKFEVEQRSKDLEIASRKAEVAELQRNLVVGGSVALFLIALLIIYLLRERVRENHRLARLSENQRKKEQEIAELKLEKHLLERQRLLNELDHRTRQLTSNSLHLIQNKQLLEDVQDELMQVSAETDSGTRTKLSKIAGLVEYGQTLEEDWQRFQGFFDSLHKSFFDNLKTAHEELTTNDLRLCALIRLNFSAKEAASILNITHGSIKTARYRLRKKLGLDEGDDLYTVLMKY